MADTKKVLIVEDEKSLARALELKLISAGFEVKVAVDGREAVALAKAEPFDVILLDLIMPVLDGFGVLSQLKAMGNKAKVIVTSNLSQKEDIDKAKNLGACDYVVKSDMSLAQIVDIVNSGC